MKSCELSSRGFSPQKLKLVPAFPSIIPSPEKTLHSRSGHHQLFIYDGAKHVLRFKWWEFSPNRPDFVDEYFCLDDLPKKALESFNYQVGDIIPLKKVRHFFKLATCGKWGEVKFFCKSCQESGREGHLSTTYVPIRCDSRYCTSVDCLVHRYASTYEQLQSIKGIGGLRGMQHWTIGFKSVPLDYFLQNWRSMKKDYEYTMNAYWSKMKKNGLVLQGIRVLDFSFESDGMVYPHYHLAIKPFARGQARNSLSVINSSKRELLGGKRTRVMDFHFQRHDDNGRNILKPTASLLAYLSKRSSGMYKRGEGKNLKWDTGKGALRKAIKSGKYFYLSDFMSMDDFLNLFFGTRHFATVGGLPRGTKPMDNINGIIPNYCNICQKELGRDGIRVQTEIVNVPPPDFRRKQNEDLCILLGRS
jgi:hypothetical protein